MEKTKTTRVMQVILVIFTIAVVLLGITSALIDVNSNQGSDAGSQPSNSSQNPF